MASDSGSKRELAGRTVDMLVDVAQQITTLSIGLIVVLAGFLEWRGIQSASGRWIASVVVILFGSCIIMALVKSGNSCKSVGVSHGLGDGFNRGTVDG